MFGNTVIIAIIIIIIIILTISNCHYEYYQISREIVLLFLSHLDYFAQETELPGLDSFFFSNSFFMDIV